MEHRMNNNMPSKTGWIILVTAFLMLLLELYVLFFAPEMKTISEAFWNMNDRATSVAFALGYLGGHFFWPRRLK